MGIFDIFGTGDQTNAANDQKTGLNQGYGQLSDFLGQGRGAVNTSLLNSTGALTGALGSATDAYGRSLNNSTGAYGNGLGAATGAYDTSLGNSTGALSASLANSVAPYQTNLAVGQAGQGAYADATGANGAAGNTRAVNNFQAGPGYQYNMDQMLQNVLRGQEATGQAASGATNSDILNQAHGLADQGWQSYIGNLAPFLNSSNAAAGGIAGANQNFGNQVSQVNQNTASGLSGANLTAAGGVAGANQNTASGVAGTNVNVGNLLAAANQNAGNQTNQSFTTQGNAAYGTQAGIGNANASADLAGLNASGNIMNALMQGGKLAASFMG